MSFRRIIEECIASKVVNILKNILVIHAILVTALDSEHNVWITVLLNSLQLFIQLNIGKHFSSEKYQKALRLENLDFYCTQWSTRITRFGGKPGNKSKFFFPAKLSDGLFCTTEGLEFQYRWLKINDTFVCEAFETSFVSNIHVVEGWKRVDKSCHSVPNRCRIGVSLFAVCPIIYIRDYIQILLCKSIRDLKWGNRNRTKNW